MIYLNLRTTEVDIFLRQKNFDICKGRLGRVVKAIDLKSIGFSRAGSNPAAVEKILFRALFQRIIIIREFF